jgi:hypothetical protein
LRGSVRIEILGDGLPQQLRERQKPAVLAGAVVSQRVAIFAVQRVLVE